MTLGQIMFGLRTKKNKKLQILTKTRAITLQTMNKSTRKTPGVQLYKLINISVKFQDFRINTIWAMHDII
jgi:hypothetical protein